MRPLETLLLFANLVTFFGWAASLPPAMLWMRHLAPVALLIAGAQALLEGPRWQMVPAYAFAGLFFLAWLLQSFIPAGWPAAHSWIHALAIGLGVLWLAVSAALPVIFPVFRFPPPGGPYAIGTLTYHWMNADRPEVFTADPDDRRELMVQVWYPAKAGPSSPRAPYIQDAGVIAPAMVQRLSRLLKLPAFTLGHLKYITTNAIPSAPAAGDEPSYPVLIFLSGLGSYRQGSTFQVEELVSHGYIVAAVDQPYAFAKVVFPDGRQAAFDARLEERAFFDSLIPYLAQDAVFTLDQLAALNQADPNGILTGRLDLQRAGLFGHSLGGIDGAEACRLEPRLKACLLEDAFVPAGVVRAGLQQPTMWITRDAETMRLERRRSGGWSEAAIEEHLATMRAAYEGLPGDGYFVQVPGMFHVDMTDTPLLTPLASRLGLSGPVGVRRAHRIVNACSLAFFDRHLKGQPAARFDELVERYPEVIFEARRPRVADLAPHSPHPGS